MTISDSHKSMWETITLTDAIFFINNFLIINVVK